MMRQHFENGWMWEGDKNTGVLELKDEKGDVVEVLGLVMKRYVVGGDPVINCVSIRKVDKSIETNKNDKKKS